MAEVKSQFKAAGYEEYSVPNFSRQIMSHVTSKDWHLGSHQVIGLCNKRRGEPEVSMNFPGHKTLKLR